MRAIRTKNVQFVKRLQTSGWELTNQKAEATIAIVGEYLKM